MLNKISLVPNYMAIAMAFGMIIYYTFFGTFNAFSLREDVYMCWRAILGSIQCMCFVYTVLLLSLYAQLLRNLLKYQEKHNAKQINVFMDDHFAKEREIVKSYKNAFLYGVILSELLIVGYPIFCLIDDTS